MVRYFMMQKSLSVACAPVFYIYIYIYIVGQIGLFRLGELISQSRRSNVNSRSLSKIIRWRHNYYVLLLMSYRVWSRPDSLFWTEKQTMLIKIATLAHTHTNTHMQWEWESERMGYACEAFSFLLILNLKRGTNYHGVQSGLLDNHAKTFSKEICLIWCYKGHTYRSYKRIDYMHWWKWSIKYKVWMKWNLWSSQNLHHENRIHLLSKRNSTK